MADLDEPARALLDALQHLRGADAALAQCLTLLRQERREIPESVDDALQCVRDALQILEE